MRNIIIAAGAILCLVVLGIVSLLPQNKDIQPTFVGKRYVQKAEIKPVSNIIQEDWYSTSEYAGKDVQFGLNKFTSGKSYTLPKIGVDMFEDVWNYVNGSWFEWESADGTTYSVRMRDGFINGFKVGMAFKPIELLYDTTYGFTRALELFIFNGVLNTEIMPFVDSQKRQVKYFTEETQPPDYYYKVGVSKGVTNERFNSFPEDTMNTVREANPKPVKETTVYGLKIGETAPLFDMELLDGRKYNLSDYYGQKTVVNMWATWCGICITEFPIINEAYNKNKSVNILAVCSDGTPRQIERIKTKYSSRYPCEFTMASSLGIDKAYGLKGFPTTYFLDEYGVIRYIKIGAFTSYEEVENILKSY